MEIIKMTKEDAVALAELDEICFAVPWSAMSFRQEAENPVASYFVAKENSRIVGYGGIWKVQDEGQITNIAVHPDMRKNGIASKLLEKLIDAVADCKSIVLEVRESNTAAISLYEKYGFKNCGIRKNFYHSPTENGIVMIRGEM